MKKKLLIGILVLALIFSFPATVFASSYVKTLNAGGSLNLREGPGKDYGVVSWVVDGDEIELLSDGYFDGENYEWCEVLVTRTNKTGYIKKMYVTDAYNPGMVAGKSVYVSSKGGSIILRAGAGTGYGVVSYVQHGDKVTVLSAGSVWAKVSLDKNGLVGYIKTKYIYKYAGGGSSGTDTPYYGSAVIATKTAGGRVNLRTGPASSYASVTTLGRGAALTVTEKSGNWYKVSTATGYVGYVYKDYVSFTASSYVSASVNLRAGAGMGYGIYTVVPRGASVSVLGYSGNWTKISYNGYTGYVYSTYVK